MLRAPTSGAESTDQVVVLHNHKFTDQSMRDWNTKWLSKYYGRYGSGLADPVRDSTSRLTEVQGERQESVSI